MSYKVQYDQGVVNTAIHKLTFGLNALMSNSEDEFIVLTVLEGGSYLSSKMMSLLPRLYQQRVINKSIKVSSYHGQERGNISFDYVPDIDFKDKNVIIIDDFCDSGNTINALNRYFKEKGAKTIHFFTLLVRERFQVDKDVKLKYGILDKTDHFYIGCGLDDNDKSRFLDELVYEI